MATSSRLAVAVHALTLLAHEDEDALSSDFIAGSVRTNPVVIRRLLAALKDAGLVTSTSGPGGGWRLARPPAAVTFADVRRAVEPEALLGGHGAPPNPECPVGGTIEHVLQKPFRAAERALDDELARTTIADALRRVRRRGSA
jgi:Rrf2 family protein